MMVVRRVARVSDVLGNLDVASRVGQAAWHTCCYCRCTIVREYVLEKENNNWSGDMRGGFSFVPGVVAWGS